MFYADYLISLTHLCFIAFLSLYIVLIDVLIYPAAQLQESWINLLTYLLTGNLYIEVELFTIFQRRTDSLLADEQCITTSPPIGSHCMKCTDSKVRNNLPSRDKHADILFYSVNIQHSAAQYGF